MMVSEERSKLVHMACEDGGRCVFLGFLVILYCLSLIMYPTVQCRNMFCCNLLVYFSYISAIFGNILIFTIFCMSLPVLNCYRLWFLLMFLTCLTKMLVNRLTVCLSVS